VNGNTTSLTSPSGNVVQRFVYDPYGTQTVLAANWSATTDAYHWLYGYQGGRLDPNTTLINFRHRDYSPILGRWIEPDPAGYVDGGSLYQFALSNSLRFTDPLGTEHLSRGFEFENNLNYDEWFNHHMPWTPSVDVFTNTSEAMNSIQDLRDGLESEGESYNPNSSSFGNCSYCVDVVTIYGHGSNGGLVFGLNDHNSENIFTHLSPQIPNSPEMRFLNAIRGILCAHATVRFVMCDSGTFGNDLASFFGPGVTVVGYQGPVSLRRFGGINGTPVQFGAQ
jgi:RHS repeat-associated protein